MLHKFKRQCGKVNAASWAASPLAKTTPYLNDAANQLLVTFPEFRSETQESAVNAHINLRSRDKGTKINHYPRLPLQRLGRLFDMLCGG